MKESSMWFETNKKYNTGREEERRGQELVYNHGNMNRSKILSGQDKTLKCNLKRASR